MHSKRRKTLILIFTLTPILLLVTAVCFDTKKQLPSFYLNNIDDLDPSYLLYVNSNPGIRDDYSINLYDLAGNILKTWTFSEPPYHARLLSNSNILVSFMIGDDSIAPGNKVTGKIAEYTWSGELVWELQDPLMHHDFLRVGDRTTYIKWQRIPSDKGKRISGGIEDTEFDGSIWGGVIVEVNKQKEVTWIWESFNYLDPKEYPLEDNHSRAEWTHFNSIFFMENNPINGKSAYMVSSRRLSKIFIIDYDSKKVIWESPSGLLKYQHDPSLVEDKILLFDNSIYDSRVVLIDPKSNEIVWEYKGSSDNQFIHNYQFFSMITSGVQKLENGNLHITMGVQGMVFEINMDKKRVWHLVPQGEINPSKAGWPYSFTFKSYRYHRDSFRAPVSLPPPIPQKVWILNWMQSLYSRIKNRP
jgi:hypothetical protein